MKVLVTGAAGELGRDLCPWLAQHFDVRQTDLVPCVNELEYVRADITEPAEVAAVMQGVDAVVHLAVILPVPASTSAFVDVNTKGTTLLLEAALQAGAKRFVYASTVWVTGHGAEERPQPVDEFAACRPLDVYGLTKLQGELSCEFYARTQGLGVLTLRLCGYRRWPGFAWDGSMDWATADLPGLALRLLQTGQKLCDPADLGRAFKAALEAEVRDYSHTIIGLERPFGPADLDLLEGDPEAALDRAYPGAKDFLSGAAVDLPPLTWWYCTEKARRDFGFAPLVTLADVIAESRRREGAG